MDFTSKLEIQVRRLWKVKIFTLLIQNSPDELTSRIQHVTDFKIVARNILERFQESASLITTFTYNIIKKIEEKSIRYEDLDPVDDLIRNKIGCTETCPFCGATCDSPIPCDGINKKHDTCIHRPEVCTP